MIDLLFQIALSNVGISLALAIVAVVVGIFFKRPALSHLLWLLVIVKLLTPSLVTIPVATFSEQADPTPTTIFAIEGQPEAAAALTAGSEKAAFFSAETWSKVLIFFKPWLFLSWLLGSLFVFAWSLLRVFRFSRLLKRETEKGSIELQSVAAKIASRLRLRSLSTIYTTSAHLFPMVWWTGGKIKIVIPEALLDQMHGQQFQWILAFPAFRPPAMASKINSGGLLGPNGAGKTTLMRILVTLLKQTSGNATINGLDLQKDRKSIRQMTGYLPQGFSTFAKLKVWEFLDYSASLNKKDKKSKRLDKVDRFLEDVSLFDVRDRRANKLSGGMKRRLGISQTLIGAPKFMVIDEPTTGLDPEERVKFRSLLSDFSREDRIIILSTHIVGDISSTCSSVALLNSGNIAFHDTPEELINTAKGKVWTLNASHSELDRLKEEFTVISTVPSKEGYELRVVAESINGQAAKQADPNLEDAYVYFMQTLGVKEPQEEEDWSGSSFEDKDHV